MFHRKRMLLAAAIVLAASYGWSAEKPAPSSPQSTREEAAKLIALVQKADTPQFDKMVACRRLAVIGGPEAVPVLAALLADEKYSHIARFGLEPIPDPSVDDAFRAALPKLQGKLLVGVINSIGYRRDVKAEDDLAKLLGNADPQVAAAAALGRIGDPRASQLLQQALAGPAALRPAVADACLVCAERLVACGQQPQGVALYDALCQTDLPKHLHTAALEGAILGRQAAGLSLLLKQLSADQIAFGVALHTMRVLPGAEVTSAVVAELDKLPVERQALVITALGDRGDPAVLPAAIKAAGSSVPAVRMAAIRALAHRAEPQAVALLLDAATGSDAELAAAAQEGLADLQGSAVDAALLVKLNQADQQALPVVIDLIGQRRITSANAALMKAADDPREAVCIAALKALGELVTLDELPQMIDRFVHPKSPQEAAAVGAALKAACARMTDRDACTDKLWTAMTQAPAESKTALLELVAGVGGAKALSSMAAAARGDPELQDTASRLLGEWMTPDVAPVLLDLAKTAGDSKYQVRALRGYIRVARQLDLPAQDKLAICQEAFALASRNDEKKLVLSALARIPSAGALALVVPRLSDADLKEDACAAAVSIGEKMKKRPAVLAVAMKKVIQTTSNEDLSRRAKKLLKQSAKGGK